MPGATGQYADVAQLGEQCLDKAWVVGSSPTVGTMGIQLSLSIENLLYIPDGWLLEQQRGLLPQKGQGSSPLWPAVKSGR